MTMLRFEPNKRVGFREYMRFDGTRSYFFCVDTVRDLFTGSGFNEVLVYCHNCHDLSIWPFIYKKKKLISHSQIAV